MIKKVFSILGFASLFLVTGCLKENEEPVQKTRVEVNQMLTKPHSYNIPELDAEKISQMIKERKGRVLFINVWATWCKPCLEEFPEFVKIFNEYKMRSIDFVSLSVDQPEDDSLVIATVKKFSAGFNVYIVSGKKSEEIINLLNINWSGAIPATFIYNRNGEQEKFVLGARGFNFFKSTIDSVLYN